MANSHNTGVCGSTPVFHSTLKYVFLATLEDENKFHSRTEKKKKKKKKKKRDP
jgi:hypothetical protein